MSKYEIRDKAEAIDLILDWANCIVSNLAFEECHREKVDDEMRTNTVTAVYVLKDVLDSVVESIYADVAEAVEENYAEKVDEVEKRLETECLLGLILGL